MGERSVMVCPRKTLACNGSDGASRMQAQVQWGSVGSVGTDAAKGLMGKDKGRMQVSPERVAETSASLT